MTIRNYISASNAYRNTVLCFLGELLSYTLTARYFPYMVHSIISFGWGILGVIFLYQGITHKTIRIIKLSSTKIPPKNIPIILIITIIVVFISGAYFYGSALIKYDDYSASSDVIPQACILAQRFIEGEKVYQTIHFNGYDLEPTYLPFTWLPFSLTTINRNRSQNINPYFMVYCSFIGFYIFIKK